MIYEPLTLATESANEVILPMTSLNFPE